MMVGSAALVNLNAPNNADRHGINLVKIASLRTKLSVSQTPLAAASKVLVARLAICFSGEIRQIMRFACGDNNHI